jgi:hypothetical protein
MKFDAADPFPNWAEGAAEHLAKWLRRDAIVVEWGAGASTLWLSDRVPDGFVVAAEHTSHWFEMVRRTGRYRHNIGLMKVPEVGMTYTQAPLRTCSDRQTVYIIDGLFRPDCFELAYAYAESGDIIVMDDALDYMVDILTEGMDGMVIFRDPHPYAGTPRRDGTPHPEFKETWIWGVDLP